MKAIQIVAPGRAILVETERPRVRPGYVLVKTTHVSLCGSDIRMLHHSARENYPFPPGTTGHEMVGLVADVADQDLPFAVGQRVLALAPDHRAMAEYYLTPRDFVLPLPEEVPSEVGLQAQQLGTVYYAAQRLPNMVGKTVAVIGQGSAGLWFNWVLRRMGAERVVAVDLDPARLAHATRFGATEVALAGSCDAESVAAVQALLGGELPEVVVEAAGEPAAINLSVEMVRKFGDILFFGVPRCQEMGFRMELFFRKCCRSTTIVGATEEDQQRSTRMAIRWIAADPMLASSLITHRFPLENAPLAYDFHRQRTDRCLKIVVEFAE
jgi:L-iditol 2-dehydrogenase